MKSRKKKRTQLFQKCWGQSCEVLVFPQPPCPPFPVETCCVYKGQRSLPACDCQRDAEYTQSPVQHQEICLGVVFWSPLPTQPVSYFREKHLFSLDSMVIVQSYMAFLRLDAELNVVKQSISECYNKTTWVSVSSFDCHFGVGTVGSRMATREV